MPYSSARGRSTRLLDTSMKNCRKALSRLLRGILVFGAIFWARSSVSGEIIPAACLPESGFKVARVGTGDSIAAVLRRLGKPIETQESEGADDGGTFQIRRFLFKEFEVDAGRDRIIRIASTTVGHEFSDGVRIGMDMGEVARRLRFRPWYGEEAIVKMESCGNNRTLLAVLHFKASDSSLAEFTFPLVRIEVTEYGP